MHAMNLKLLIVDDSRMSRMILQGLVQQHQPQWSVVHASTGDEAVAIVREQAIDLVSMDFNMPGMNGLEAVAALRQHRPELPVALMTANVQAAVQQQAQALNVLFLPKPITAESVHRLATLLKQPQGDA
jgi:CheY-like chemotaxis protein